MQTKESELMGPVVRKRLGILEWPKEPQNIRTMMKCV